MANELTVAAAHVQHPGRDVVQWQQAGCPAPNRRITLDGHHQRLSELSYRALRTWLDHRRATWPRTPQPARAR